MGQKTKKIEREFLLTDNTVNVYGFRLLTEGFQKEKYTANPIGYLMHDRKGGVVLRWEDVRVDGQKVFGKPVINLTHPDGEKIASEVENGFLNAASVGHIVVLETSEAPDLMMEGQTGPTVTKWFCKEISLVDIPGNPNALIQLFDKDDNEINLTDFVQDTLRKLNLSHNFQQDLNTQKMDFKAQLIKGLNLADNTADSAVESALQNLIDKAAKVDSITRAKEQAEKELKDLKAETVKSQVADLLDKAIDDKKITKEQQTVLAADYGENPEGLKNLIATMKPYKSVVDSLADQEKNVPEKFKGKTLMQLHAEDLLEELMSDYPDLYADLKKKAKA